MRACAAPSSASPSSARTACAATSTAASTARGWKARSATTMAAKAAGARLRSSFLGQALVRAVAEGHRLGALAAAQPYLLRLAHGELHRPEVGFLVRAVAEGLAPGPPACTPPVVARGELDGVRSPLGDVRFCHAPS